jgi:predicted peptidase
LPLALAVLAGSATAAGDDAERFESHLFRNARAETLPYRLFVPEGLQAGKKYPLVVWLHGGGGRGSDNRSQLAEGNAAGALVWVRPENQVLFPSFVLAPQCPSGKMWTTIGDTVEAAPPLRLVVELIRQLSENRAIDAGRVYIAGQSMGGFGAWALASELPGMFAAAVPVCGGGTEKRAARLARVPVWAFHGELDRAVSVERSRRMIAAIRRAGGRPRYTEYEGAEHVIWDRVFAEPELLPWVFAQERGGAR